MLVQVWVLVHLPPWNVSRREVLSLSTLYIRVVTERFLDPLKSVLVHYFSATILLYFSVALWMSSGAENSFSVSQPSFVSVIKKFNVEFVPDNRTPKIWQNIVFV